MKDPTLLDYYARRAEEYEQIYQKPERQAKLALLKAYLVKLLAGRDMARAKAYPPRRVRFEQADAYTLEALTGAFIAGFAGFWWSHVPKARLPGFLSTFHGKLQPGARVVFVDNHLGQRKCPCSP